MTLAVVVVIVVKVAVAGAHIGSTSDSYEHVNVQWGGAKDVLQSADAAQVVLEYIQRYLFNSPLGPQLISAAALMFRYYAAYRTWQHRTVARWVLPPVAEC